MLLSTGPFRMRSRAAHGPHGPARPPFTAWRCPRSARHGPARTAGSAAQARSGGPAHAPPAVRALPPGGLRGTGLMGLTGRMACLGAARRGGFFAALCAARRAPPHCPQGPHGLPRHRAPRRGFVPHGGPRRTGFRGRTACPRTERRPGGPCRRAHAGPAPEGSPARAARVARAGGPVVCAPRAGPAPPYRPYGLPTRRPASLAAGSRKAPQALRRTRTAAPASPRALQGPEAPQGFMTAGRRSPGVCTSSRRGRPTGRWRCCRCSR